MTINHARSILGKSGKKLSDEDILKLLQKMKTLAIICMEKIDIANNKDTAPAIIV